MNLIGLIFVLICIFIILRYFLKKKNKDEDNDNYPLY